ncbi:MAG: cupin domain-containing protein [Alphaproteobacteria bacterium]|nr:cupin domain-containing protein [Alphaproteobacteria bacterium]
MNNLFDILPGDGAAEVFTDIAARPGARIEHIVSTGQATPEHAPYDQDHDEWVLLLTGVAGLWIDGEGEQMLRPGDHVMIPAHCQHRVTWTTADQATTWLAVHFVASIEVV